LEWNFGSMINSLRGTLATETAGRSRTSSRMSVSASTRRETIPGCGSRTSIPGRRSCLDAFVLAALIAGDDETLAAYVRSDLSP
jgi:hypothetical protein